MSIKRLYKLFLLILTALLLTACLGPKPVVRDYSLIAPAQGSSDPYKVDVTLANEGPGGGQVELQVNLLNKKTGDIIAQQEKAIDLPKDKVMQVELLLDIPQSARSLTTDDIEVTVEADYPVE